MSDGFEIFDCVQNERHFYAEFVRHCDGEHNVLHVVDSENFSASTKNVIPYHDVKLASVFAHANIGCINIRVFVDSCINGFGYDFL